MKKIEVVAAIINKDGKFFATQRGYGKLKGKWEFPGGKIEAGESCEEALKREIREELGVAICVNEHFHSVEYTYPDFHITLHCFLSTIVSGEIKLLEHSSAKWLAAEQIDQVDWLPADIEVIEKIKSAFAE